MNGIDIKIERIRRGIRQYELAARAGMHVTELSEFENGRRELSPTKLDRVIAALGIRQEATV